MRFNFSSGTGSIITEIINFDKPFTAMKKLILSCIALMAAATLWAAPSCTLSGVPVTKKTTNPVIGALVTLTEVGNKSNKFQRIVGENGFEMIIPFGEYQLSIEAAGYETYTLDIDIDTDTIDLGIMRMLTDQMAEERDNAKAAKKRRD